MIKTNQSDSRYDNALKITKRIVRKSAKDRYIYRGEHRCHEKVSSGLYRAYADFGIKDREVIPDVIGEANEKISEALDAYFGDDSHVRQLKDVEQSLETTVNFSDIARIQHYGGKTKLIDFTNDYLIALFFCLSWI